MKRSGQSGMTLVEVLVAVTLVSLLSLGMLLALQAGLSAMETSSRRFLDNRRVMGAQRILEQQVAGFLPVMARCGADPAGAQGSPVPYFMGMPAAMRFVTSYSLQGATRGVPQMLELFVIPGDQGRGVRLVANEVPYVGPVGAGFRCKAPQPQPDLGIALPVFPMPQPTPRSFVLADKLTACRFLYLESVPPEKDKWVARWTRMDVWPRALRIEMFPLEPSAARLPPLTFTGLVRPNKPPQEQYAY